MQSHLAALDEAVTSLSRHPSQPSVSDVKCHRRSSQATHLHPPPQWLDYLLWVNPAHLQVQLVKYLLVIQPKNLCLIPKTV